MTTATYIRVSTIGQNLDGQRLEIQRWIDGNGAQGVRWFVDHGATGKNLARPAFQQLQQAIFMGEIDCVVIYRLDRLSRDLKDGINVLCGWLDAGVQLIVTSQGFDFSGALGKTVAALLLGLAEFKQETRKERAALGIAAAKARGAYKGRAKGSTKSQPSRARQLRGQGLTAVEIAAAMKISRRTVWRYLSAAS